MYNDLVHKDKGLYTQNGILRDTVQQTHQAVARAFPGLHRKVNLVIACEERIYDQVLEDLNFREQETFQPVHIINVDIQDNHEKAILGAIVICELCQGIQNTDDMNKEMDRLLQEFEEKSHRSFLPAVCFY